MKKLTLELDSLRVESFETAADARLRGTVRGNDSYTVSPYPSCARTCGASPPPDTEICRADQYAPTLQQACCV